MARGVPRSTLHQLRTLFAAGTTTGRTDGELLERFAEGRAGASAREADSAEAAFAALVDRHGPMVWGVCLRVLGNAHEAEDAFQATFLVLARRAGTVRGETLGRWLYGVARKVAWRARRQAERRRSIRSLHRPPDAGDPVREAELDDLRAALGEELGRLRAECRAAIELCHLQGLTQDEAARRLDCSRRTVKSRLAAGRRRLRARLERRGFAPAAVPVALFRSTVRTAMISATGEAGAFPASIAALATGAMRAMFLNKLTIGVVLVLAATGAVVHAVQREEPASPASSANDLNRPEADDSLPGQTPRNVPNFQPPGQKRLDGGNAFRLQPDQAPAVDHNYRQAQDLVEAIHRLESRGRRDEALVEVQRLLTLVQEWGRSIQEIRPAMPQGQQSSHGQQSSQGQQSFQRQPMGSAYGPGASNNSLYRVPRFEGISQGGDQERRIQRLESLIEKLLEERGRPQSQSSSQASPRH